MKYSEHKTNKINYGAMTIKVESKTTDDVNYEVRITDDTLYRSDNISDKIIAVLSFNTINPDSLKIISSSKDYSSNRTSLFTTFANININRTNDCLTTSIEKANFLVLNKTKNDFKGYISVPKVIIS